MRDFRELAGVSSAGSSMNYNSCRVASAVQGQTIGHSRNAAAARGRGRFHGSSEGALLSRLHRGLGALLVLRHDGAAGALHGEPAAAAGARREHRRVRWFSSRDRIRGRAAFDAGARVADLRPLRGLRVLHATARRPDRGPLDRAAQRRRDRRAVDVRRAPGDGVRAIVPAGPAAARDRLGIPQGQHLGPGGRPLPA